MSPDMCNNRRGWTQTINEDMLKILKENQGKDLTAAEVCDRLGDKYRKFISARIVGNRMRCLYSKGVESDWQNGVEHMVRVYRYVGEQK